MKKTLLSAIRLLLVCTLCLISTPIIVQAQEAASPADMSLAERIAALEKELQALRSQMAMLIAATAPTPAAAAAIDGTAPATTETRSTLSSLLGSTSLSGFVDIYYGYNFNHPASRSAALRAFDAPSNQFSLNMVELIFNKDPDANNSRLGYKVALGYGQAMNVVNASDPTEPAFAQCLKEAYFSYLAPMGKGLQIDVGKFVTPHGAEVIETKDNWNYSRGLLFTYAIPFYHFGARARYTFNEKYSLTGFVVNGWNNVVDNNTGKTLAATFAWTPNKKFSLVQNYMAGPEQANTNDNWRQLSDMVMTIAPNDKLTLAVNYDYGREGRSGAVPIFWTGVAAYARFVVNTRTRIAARYEHYDDRDGFTTGTAQKLNGVTATFERVVAQDLLTRLEFRRDVSDFPAFRNRDLPVTSQNTFSGGLVYVFDSKEKR